MSLPNLSLRKPVTVLVLTAALVVLGAVSVSRLKLDFLPQMDLPFIGVYVPYPNAVPDQVEREIARPIEEIMATLGDIDYIFSQSDDQSCFVGVTFQFGRSVDALRMEVKEKMDQVKPSLPRDLRDYYLFSFNSNDIPIIEGRISARGRDLAGSYDLLERSVINPLRRIEGVGRVQVDGVLPQQVSIYLWLDKIIQHQVDVDRLFRELNANNVDLSAGMVRDGRRKVVVRSLGQFRDLSEIENLRVNAAGIRLKDVAEVIYGEPAPSYRRHLNGEPAVAFSIQKASGANIVDVSRRVGRVLEEIRRDPALEGIDVVLFFDQADQIRNSLKGLLSAGLFGSVLAIAVLYLFLRRLRTTLIISIAIPFSVIATCSYLYLTGRTLNVLTMMGLMLAVGMLVDNAIVVLESIHRRENGEGPWEAARAGTAEVAMAVTASTLTTVIVFAAVVLSKGNMFTSFMSEVGLTLSITMLFSLLVCLTLVPLMASRSRDRGAAPEFGFLRRARERYVRLLGWTALRHPRRTGLLLLPGVVILTVLVAKVAGFGPEPESERGMKLEFLRIGFDLKDNANIYRVEEYVLPVERFLLARADSLRVESVYSVYEDNAATIRLYFDREARLGEGDMKELRRWLRERLPVQAGVEYRLGEDEEAGRGAQRLSVTLFGDDSQLLEGYAAEVQRRLRLIPGLEDVHAGRDRSTEEIQVRLDRDRAAALGLNPRSLAQVLGLTFRGVPLRDFETREREVEMGIMLEPTQRRTIENLSALPVTMVEDRAVRLDQVAHFEMGRSAGQIYRERQKTARTVTGSYEGKEFKALTDEVRRMMDGFDLPAGYSWSFGREMQRSRQEQNEMGLDILLAICCVYFVMAALFESLLHPLVIMLCIPFAALGVIWTLLATHTPFNIMAMIGIVVLIGVIVNNGIVLVDRINHLRREGMRRGEAILAGGRDRFRPILMTASTTALGLIPMAVGDSSIGDAKYSPMARAILGGLLAGTALTLIVLPTFYVLAEDAALHFRAVLAWGRGRGPLPWRRGPVPARPLPDPPQHPVADR